MDIQNLLVTLQHMHLQKIIHNHHARHYIWEISKVLIPAMLTALVTFVAMKVTDGRNKKRWVNDGHMKRKVDLEIQIRKFLLGIKGNIPDGYYALADRENEESDAQIIEDFNKDFEILYKYLEAEEQERGSDIYNDQRISTLMDEYVCYVPKIQNLFNDFKAMSSDILKMERENSEQLKDKANIYLCFQDVVERVFKKLNVRKIIK